jgi:hypothetical protein
MTQPSSFKQLLNIIYEYGCSPRIRQHIQTLKTLIPKIDPNKKEELIADGCLTYLSHNKNIPDDVLQDLLQLLIKKGADKNYRDNTGNILHGFIRANRYELFTEFVKTGVDINAKTTTGMGSTPLHAAVEKNKPAFVEYLLDCEAIDPTIKDKEGRTARDLITEQTDEAISQAFEKWEKRQKWQKRPEPQQGIQIHGIFSASNAVSTSIEYPVSKTLVKRRQQQGYQLVSQDDEDKNELPEHEGNRQSSWLSNFISKLVS